MLHPDQRLISIYPKISLIFGRNVCISVCQTVWLFCQKKIYLCVNLVKSTYIFRMPEFYVTKLTVLSITVCCICPLKITGLISIKCHFLHLSNDTHFLTILWNVRYNFLRLAMNQHHMSVLLGWFKVERQLKLLCNLCTNVQILFFYS